MHGENECDVLQDILNMTSPFEKFYATVENTDVQLVQK
jgi:hypothetical protein